MISGVAPNGLAYTLITMPKTGGSAAKAALEGYGTERKGRMQHVSADEAIARGLVRGELLATVRGPHEWYHSLWHYQRPESATAVGFARASVRSHLERWGRGSDRFREVLYGYTHPREVPVFGGQCWLNNPGGEFIPGTGGYYSWCRDYWHGPEISRYLRTESLDEDMARILGTSPPGRVNCTARPDWRKAYDPEMLSWVAHADGGYL